MTKKVQRPRKEDGTFEKGGTGRIYGDPDRMLALKEMRDFCKMEFTKRAPALIEKIAKSNAPHVLISLLEFLANHGYGKPPIVPQEPGSSVEEILEKIARARGLIKEDTRGIN